MTDDEFLKRYPWPRRMIADNGDIVMGPEDPEAAMKDLEESGVDVKKLLKDELGEDILRVLEWDE